MNVNKIIQQIKETASSYPNQLYYDDRLTTITGTYQALEEQSNALAHYFIEHLPNKQPILVKGGLNKEMIITFLACLKSGHPYVPVDTHTPDDRLHMIYEEAQPGLVVSFDEWPLATNQLINLQQFNQITSVYKDVVDPTYWVKQDDLVYIIFTSGTTGKPKGVQITYNNLISYTDWMLSDFKLKKQQRFLCQAPFSFDLSVMDLYPALLTEGTLVPLAKNVTDNFPILFKTLPSLNINVWVSTPSFMEICLMDSQVNQEQMASLSHFLFCGEELPHNVATKLSQQFPASLIFNTYGPTEATVAVTSVPITQDILATYPRLPLGKVKSDTQLVILETEPGEDDDQIGEILIVGPSVSPGYYQNPEKTAEAFVQYDGQAAYKTGDLGYIKNDLLFYQGRMDDQIKLHGYRIELGDIEHHLEDINRIRRACVLPKYQNGKVKQLIAYIVMKEASELNDRQQTTEIKSELSHHLMPYMIPQKFIYLDSFPLTANGKINRKELAQGGSSS
ncbi:D-alanine--poly(phosphoribitol) ligase subunit DltA [Vagococcus xieshaowenii]|uniref:D-alanine--D-alanyl carrier protein ligase n=1 Tax=Vagococcus xieshaowenii TaxID=2562451 RepID=A0A4Z0DCI6_9ENTE|nr:D-alanine--poly(phosphoribitol) ligase subunit DltA [Vagococcus xieshaowenii]QCA29528.1 D-alanine--poly(phosphoribitol) ligase subunit DltA [Vagococcus xieshaowenii]TFZ42644.1 D-alanine--poly(phosphoribitol) ligase subunit DltA [Vagococcus xieshaowenii]